MFLPHCHHTGLLFGSNQSLFTGLLLGFAIAERELQDQRQREQFEKSENEKKNTPAPRPY